MSNKITLKVIESQVATLNDMTGRNKHVSDKVYAIDQAYGGVQLVLRDVKCGSESNISYRGTKRELSNQLSAIINVLNRDV